MSYLTLACSVCTRANLLVDASILLVEKSLRPLRDQMHEAGRARSRSAKATRSRPLVGPALRSPTGSSVSMIAHRAPPGLQPRRPMKVNWD